MTITNNSLGYFPIKKGVACPLKWSWNTVRLAEATTACCHKVQAVPLSIENFDNFHNDPVWIEHRKMQLDGKFPQSGCQSCEHVEAQGGMSDRLYHMNQVDMSPPELDADPEAVHVTPRVLEIFINNACNLACVYCDESNSSRIAKENQKFGHAVPGESVKLKPIIHIVPKTVDHQLLLGKFFQYLDKNYQNLRKLNVLGGEPFYQKEFGTLVDFIVANQNQKLNFTVVSNLMVSPNVIESFVDKMKYTLASRRLQRVDITASIDCWGDEQEYVRYGIDLDQWMKNFEYLAKHKWLYMSVNNTISSLTIKTLPDLLKYVNSLRKTRPIHHAFDLVVGRPHLHPKIFGPGYFDQDFTKVLNLMPDETDQDRFTKQHMQGIIKSVNASTVDLELQKNLKCYLNEIDRRRGANWQHVFPWLAKELEYVV
jgi:pyruvate-formate lyase-activating enzyme